jgi:hypothetical protein
MTSRGGRSDGRCRAPLRPMGLETGVDSLEAAPRRRPTSSRGRTFPGMARILLVCVSTDTSAYIRDPVVLAESRGSFKSAMISDDTRRVAEKAPSEDLPGLKVASTDRRGMRGAGASGVLTVRAVKG